MKLVLSRPVAPHRVSFRAICIPRSEPGKPSIVIFVDTKLKSNNIICSALRITDPLRHPNRGVTILRPRLELESWQINTNPPLQRQRWLHSGYRGLCFGHLEER
jgi:hypothetical protein